MPGNEPLSAAELEDLYVRLEKRVFNVVYRWLFDDAEAAEVTQEAFLRIWRARERVRRETVEALIFTSAIRLASNRKRMRRLRQLVGVDDDSVAPGSPEDAIDHQRVRDAVAALPERLRRVVVLCEFSGMSHAQIGEALGIPPGTVGSRRNTALKLLREKLDAG